MSRFRSRRTHSMNMLCRHGRDRSLVLHVHSRQTMKDNETNILRKGNRAASSGTGFPGEWMKSSSGAFEEPPSLPENQEHRERELSEILKIYLQHVGDCARKKRHRYISQELGKRESEVTMRKYKCNVCDHIFEQNPPVVCPKCRSIFVTEIDNDVSGRVMDDTPVESNVSRPHTEVAK